MNEKLIKIFKPVEQDMELENDIEGEQFIARFPRNPPSLLQLPHFAIRRSAGICGCQHSPVKYNWQRLYDGLKDLQDRLILPEAGPKFELMMWKTCEKLYSAVSTFLLFNIDLIYL